MQKGQLMIVFAFLCSMQYRSNQIKSSLFLQRTSTKYYINQMVKISKEKDAVGLLKQTHETGPIRSRNFLCVFFFSQMRKTT